MTCSQGVECKREAGEGHSERLQKAREESRDATREEKAGHPEPGRLVEDTCDSSGWELGNTGNG